MDWCLPMEIGNVIEYDKGNGRMKAQIRVVKGGIWIMTIYRDGKMYRQSHCRSGNEAHDWCLHFTACIEYV